MRRLGIGQACDGSEDDDTFLHVDWTNSMQGDGEVAQEIVLARGREEVGEDM